MFFGCLIFKNDIKLKGILSTICSLVTTGNNFPIVLLHVCVINVEYPL